MLIYALAVVQDYTLPTVQSYMYHIRSNAEAAVRTLLRKVSKQVGPVLEAIDWLDDGSPVRLTPPTCIARS